MSPLVGIQWGTHWKTGAGEGIRTLDPNLGKMPQWSLIVYHATPFTLSSRSISIACNIIVTHQSLVACYPGRYPASYSGCARYFIYERVYIIMPLDAH